MIGIVMSRFKLSTSAASASSSSSQMRDVAAALKEEAGCEGALTLEDAQALIPLIPTAEEIASIKAAADAGVALGPPERFLQSLASICALEMRLKFLVFSLEAPARVADTSVLAGRFDQAMRSTMDCKALGPMALSDFFDTVSARSCHVTSAVGAALRILLEVALVFGNTLNKV
jgi:hypothetical protein